MWYFIKHISWSSIVTDNFFDLDPGIPNKVLVLWQKFLKKWWKQKSSWIIIHPHILLNTCSEWVKADEHTSANWSELVCRCSGSCIYFSSTNIVSKSSPLVCHEYIVCISWIQNWNAWLWWEQSYMANAIVRTLFFVQMCDTVLVTLIINTLDARVCILFHYNFTRKFRKEGICMFWKWFE